MRSLKPHLIAFFLLITSNIGIGQIVAPDFSVYTTHQDSFHLYQDYLDEGKVVLIEFFFTTCPPCAEISPYMEDLYQNWGGGNEDVEFILITNKSFDETPDVADYCDQYGFTFPGVGVDGGALGVWNTYKNSPWGNLFGTPAFIVLSPDGSVQYDVSGTTVQSTLDSLNAAISDALGDPPPPQVKYYDEIISTHYHSGDTIENVFAWFIDYPTSGDTTTGPPVNGGKRTEFVPDSILENSDFSIQMQKDDGPILDEVSTFDLFFIQRGILGLEELDFYQTAAADINDDGRLSGSDIIALRRVILEIESSFPGRASWRFFPDYIPENTLDSLNYDHIWDFPKEWHYASEEENNGLLHFKGVKIGDVNHSWHGLNSSTEPSTRTIQHADLNYSYKPDSRSYDFYLSNIEGNIKSFQFDLHHSQGAHITFHTSISDDHLFYRSINDEKIRIGFFDAYTRRLQNDQVIFSISFPLSDDPDLSINKTELVDGSGQIKQVRLKKVADPTGLSIFPNPAVHSINVFSSSRSKAILTDDSGKRLQEFQLQQGRNEIDISHLHTGSYFILRVSDNSSTPFLKL